MIYFAKVSCNRTHNLLRCRRVLLSTLLLTAVGVSACSSNEKTAAQTLAKVNGEEITTLHLNDELGRSDSRAGQNPEPNRPLLESLIDRQLITDAAMRLKLDRTPEVMQAIERAKAEIISQAYLASLASKADKPSMGEICDYFQTHPEYFSHRKQFVIQQLVMASSDFSDELKLILDSAKSLDTVAVWLNQHNIRHVRGQISRSTTDLPEQMVARLNTLQKGQLFIVHEGENSLLNAISDIRDSPVSVKNAAPQIEMYLLARKHKAAAEAEIAHLRSLAKIEYLDAPASSSH